MFVADVDLFLTLKRPFLLRRTEVNDNLLQFYMYGYKPTF